MNCIIPACPCEGRNRSEWPMPDSPSSFFPGRRPRNTATCGSESGYQRHRKVLHEPACDACKAAHVRHVTRYKSPREAEMLTVRSGPLDPTWLERAACRGMDTALWFPGDHEPHQPACDVCRQCPVRAECLADALATGDVRDGIRGGLTPSQRRKERTRRNKAVA